MSAQRFDGKEYVPDQASNETSEADADLAAQADERVHDLLLQGINLLTSERDALREKVRVLREAIEAAAAHMESLAEYVAPLGDANALARRAYDCRQVLAQTAETEGR